MIRILVLFGLVWWLRNLVKRHREEAMRDRVADAV